MRARPVALPRHDILYLALALGLQPHVAQPLGRVVPREQERHDPPGLHRVARGQRLAPVGDQHLGVVGRRCERLGNQVPAALEQGHPHVGGALVGYRLVRYTAVLLRVQPVALTAQYASEGNRVRAVVGAEDRAVPLQELAVNVEAGKHRRRRRVGGHAGHTDQIEALCHRPAGRAVGFGRRVLDVGLIADPDDSGRARRHAADAGCAGKRSDARDRLAGAQDRDAPRTVVHGERFGVGCGCLAGTLHQQAGCRRRQVEMLDAHRERAQRIAGHATHYFRLVEYPLAVLGCQHAHQIQSVAFSKVARRVCQSNLNAAGPVRLLDVYAARDSLRGRGHCVAQ